MTVGEPYVHSFLEHSAVCQPSKVALVHGDLRSSYGELNATANRLARWLQNRGVGHAERVVIFLENSLEYVVSYYAILKAGAIAVPMNTDLPSQAIRAILADLEPKIVITRGRFQRRVQSAEPGDVAVECLLVVDPLEETSGGSPPVVSWSDSVADGASENLALSLDPKDVASIIFTSGSTGKPKGVMLSHGNIVANTRSIVEYLALTSEDIQMVVLPFFYVMGKSLLNTHVAVGGRVVINNRFAFPAQIIQQMIAEKVTGFSGVPSTYAYLLHRSPFRNRCGEFSLRYCTQAGGHMASALKRELLEILGENTQLFIMYGATEASARLSYVEPGKLMDKLDSIGRPIPGVSMKVLTDEGRELGVGEIGEIVASGDNIMQGYWRDPESTAKALSGQGYHTGDLGYQDDEGYFFVVGRKDEQLKVGGHKVHPREIEEAIIDTKLVLETIVLGISDPLQGYRINALVVPRSQNVGATDVFGAVSKSLPKHKIPSNIFMVDRLPKNGSGKVDRVLCKQILEANSPEI